MIKIYKTLDRLRAHQNKSGMDRIIGVSHLVKDSEEVIESLLSMLERFASYGEDEWDFENFRCGSKEVSSGDLVDCRRLIIYNKCPDCGGACRPLEGVAIQCQNCNYILCSG